MTPRDCPPWGSMDAFFVEQMARHEVPRDWQSPDPGVISWRQWRDAVVDDLASFLWPRYDAAAQAWVGAAAKDAAALTSVDFDVLQGLRGRIDEPVAAPLEHGQVHRHFYELEDQGKVAHDYHYYDPLLPGGMLQHLPRAYLYGVWHKGGSLGVQLKRELQRPRPWQVYYLQNRPGYTYESVTSAHTPSIVSGHSLQGVLGGAQMFVEFHEAGITAPACIDALQQYCVDIGDRRVFAGVHYPSDNLASWFVALTMLPLVFSGGTAEVGRFLADAILRKSLVWRAIRGHVDDAARAGRASPYAPAAQRIEDLAKHYP